MNEDAGAAAADGELASLRTKLAEAQDRHIRAAADLDNLRKRCASQISRAADETRAAVAAEWLPVVDNLERALDHAQARPDAIVEGILSVRDQALAVLADLGFPRRDDIGAKFDPARHDAVSVQPEPDAEAGTVIKVVRPGYGDGEHQLRPAQVVVAGAS